MGRIKTIERKGKRALMRALGAALHARALTPAQFRELSFDRILVIRQHNQMGDMMLATPALRAIRETYPDATIGVVTSTLNRGVLMNHPYVDRVYTFDKRNIFSQPGMLRALRRDRYQLAIVLHTVSFSFTTLLFAVLSGAPVRIGSTSPAIGDALTGSYLSITLPLPTPAQLATMNEAEHNLFPLRAVGIDTRDLSPLLVPSQESRAFAERFAAENWDEGRLRLAVHPGAGKAENIWPATHFAEVANAIASRFDVSVVAVEGPPDAAAVSAFVEASTAPVRVLRGRPIGDVAAVLQEADLVICNDTGVMHVAAAAGARTLSIFGKTDPARWAPRCDNLHWVRSPDGTLAGVAVDAVLDAAVPLLESVLLAQRDAKR